MPRKTVKKYDDDGMRLQGNYERNVKCEVMTGADPTEALLEMSVASLKQNGGRKAEYPADKEGLDRFMRKSVEYFQFIRDTNADPDAGRRLMPDIESWAVFLGITRMTISNYSKRSVEWAESIGQVKECILAVRKQLASTFKIPPVYAIFDQCNNYSYRNTADVVVEARQPEAPKSIEEIIEQIGITVPDDEG